jgi:ribosomal protein L2
MLLVYTCVYWHYTFNQYDVTTSESTASFKRIIRDRQRRIRVKEVVVATALLVTVMSLEGLRETTKICLGGRKPTRHSNVCPVFLEIHSILFQPHVHDQYEYTLILSK